MNNLKFYFAVSIIVIILLGCAKKEIRESKYDGGELKERYTVIQDKNGSYLWDGEYTLWYKSGQVAAKGYFNRRNPNDSPGQTGTPEGGRFGKWAFYSENGQKVCEVNYKNSKFEGNCYWWYESGKKKAEKKFKDGKEEGDFTVWYETSGIQTKGIIKAGVLVSLKNWKENGAEEPSAGDMYNIIGDLYKVTPVSNDNLYHNGISGGSYDGYLDLCYLPHVHRLLSRSDKILLGSSPESNMAYSRLLTLFKVSNDTSIAIIGTSVQNSICHSCQGLLSAALYIVKNKQLFYFFQNPITTTAGFETDPVIGFVKLGKSHIGFQIKSSYWQQGEGSDNEEIYALVDTHFKSVWGINTLDAREDGSSDSATFHFIIDETKDWYDIKSIVNEKTKDSAGNIVPIHKECIYSYNGEKYISTDSLSFYSGNKINNNTGSEYQDNPWKVSGINSEGKLMLPTTIPSMDETITDPSLHEGIGVFNIEKVRRAVANAGSESSSSANGSGATSQNAQSSTKSSSDKTNVSHSEGYTGSELDDCITGLMLSGMSRDRAESICKSSEGKKVMEQGRQMLRQ